MKALGISSCFPREKRPDFGVFAYELYFEMARQSMELSVIAPYSFLRKVKSFFYLVVVMAPIIRKNSFEIVRPKLLNVL
jgi:hypothetical protein